MSDLYWLSWPYSDEAVPTGHYTTYWVRWSDNRMTPISFPPGHLRLCNIARRGAGMTPRWVDLTGDYR